MRVVIAGATGNAGTSLLAALAADPAVDEIVGLARRVPELEHPKVDWRRADIARDDLVPHFRGVDAVVHLAWLIQPSRREEVTYATNVDGSARLFRAVAEAGVGSLVYASSVGAYSPGPKDRAVDESWATGGVGTSFYGRHKALVESQLDAFEREHSGIRVVRLRPGLVFKREAATGVRRLFAGPFLPSPLLRPGALKVLPDVPGLRVQAVHSLDLGEAYRLAILGEARGAFNVAAEPVLDARELARALGARLVPVPRTVARGAVAATWRLHLQPTPEGWVDLALGVPIMDTRRAREVLGWEPRRSSVDAFLELLEGMREGADYPTPPLSRNASGRARGRELATGVGRESR